jgi:hypothetical protein
VAPKQQIIYILLWKWDDDHHLGTGFLVHKGIISAGKRVEFVSDRMSYIVLRGHCHDVLNMHAPTGDKYDNTMDSCYEELEHVPLL